MENNNNYTCTLVRRVASLERVVIDMQAQLSALSAATQSRQRSASASAVDVYMRDRTRSLSNISTHGSEAASDNASHPSQAASDNGSNYSQAVSTLEETPASGLLKRETSANETQVHEDSRLDMTAPRYAAAGPGRSPEQAAVSSERRTCTVQYANIHFSAAAVYEVPRPVDHVTYDTVLPVQRFERPIFYPEALVASSSGQQRSEAQSIPNIFGRIKRLFRHRRN